MNSAKYIYPHTRRTGFKLHNLLKQIARSLGFLSTCNCICCNHLLKSFMYSRIQFPNSVHSSHPLLCSLLSHDTRQPYGRWAPTCATPPARLYKSLHSKWKRVMGWLPSTQRAGAILHYCTAMNARGMFEIRIHNRVTTGWTLFCWKVFISRSVKCPQNVSDEQKATVTI